MTAIPEPAEGTIVAWFDPHNDLFAVFQRTDAYDEEPDEANHWFCTLYPDTNVEPFEWAELLKEMNGFRGPVELVSNGDIARGGE